MALKGVPAACTSAVRQRTKNEHESLIKDRGVSSKKGLITSRGLMTLKSGIFHSVCKLFHLSKGSGKTIVPDWFHSNPLMNPMWTACLSASCKSPPCPLQAWLKLRSSPALHYHRQENPKWNKLAPVCSNSTCFLHVYITVVCIRLTVL